MARDKRFSDRVICLRLPLELDDDFDRLREAEGLTRAEFASKLASKEIRRLKRKEERGG